MQPEALIDREEVVAMIWTIADINVNVAKIVRLLEEGLGEVPEDDA
jgi:hypothetical protein